MTNILLLACGLYITFILILALYTLVLSVKSDVASRNRKIILNAIYKYHIECIEKHRYSEIIVEYFDLEPYEKTVYRLWDWGYTRILPPDKFEVIKPYL